MTNTTMRRCARCDWTAEGTRSEQLVAASQHAADADHPLCGVLHTARNGRRACSRSLPHGLRQSCLACVGSFKTDLADVERMYLRLPGVLVEGRFPSSSEAEKTAGTPEPSMPGGDALVMWAPGGAGSDTRTRDGNREHALDELSSDASSVEAVLATMEDDWRNLQEHFAAGPPGVTNSVAYLTSQVDRIAQTYSEFPDQAADVQQLRNRLAVVTGLVETPLRGADCFDCGVPLLREYGETGLVDDWTCPGCRREYTQAEYWLAVRAELEEVRGA